MGFKFLNIYFVFFIVNIICVIVKCWGSGSFLLSMWFLSLGCLVLNFSWVFIGYDILVKIYFFVF